MVNEPTEVVEEDEEEEAPVVSSSLANVSFQISMN